MPIISTEKKVYVVTKVTPEGAETLHAFTEPLTLAEIYELIGDGCDTFELVHVPGGTLMLVDEEGRLKDLPVNKAASRLAAILRIPGCAGGIHGTALFCPSCAIE